MYLLDNINNPDDLKKLSKPQLPQLAKELREFIINIVSTKEGHLGASLGVVELTIALHYYFNTPTDLLVWDVGHQAYIHKLLTNRKNKFECYRQKGGLSGFPNRAESIYDAFGTGHSSTSISAVLGMAMASKLKGCSKKHIAIIGDASIASGMAFEGLNHAGVSGVNMLVILNDNAMAIDNNVGALKNYLSSVRKHEINGDNFLENLKFKYTGPINGHDFNELFSAFKEINNHKGLSFLHIVTTKGKGYKLAEEDQVRFHAPGKFDISTGVSLSKINKFTKYQYVFGKTLVELAHQNKKIVGITPAMPSGTSLKIMMDEIPERAFDVGIAEQHAVTLAAGMSTQGLVPFIAIYSTFLQRAYDQVVHDVALQDLPVVFCIDRGGLVGEDGATHHGMFDIAWLRTIPNMIVTAPMNETDLRNLMFIAQNTKHPFTIRYPRGYGVLENWNTPFSNIEVGKGYNIKQGSEIAVLGIGHPVNFVIDAVNKLKADDENKVSVYNMLFVSPLDTSILDEVFSTYKNIITVEDGVVAGGFGSAVLEWANKNKHNNNVTILGVENPFIEHSSTKNQYYETGISSDKIKAVLLDIINSNY